METISKNHDLIKDLLNNSPGSAEKLEAMETQQKVMINAFIELAKNPESQSDPKKVEMAEKMKQWAEGDKGGRVPGSPKGKGAREKPRDNGTLV